MTPLTFDYTSLSTEVQAVVQKWTNEIKHLVRRSAQDIIEIGQKLTEVKAQLGHGHFESWLKSEFGWSLYTARRFMQVNRQFKSHNLSDFDIAASALYLLAAPSTPEEVRQQALERAYQGETITHATAKAILFQHTIDVEAETVTNEKETTALNQAPSGQELLPQPETVNEPLPITTEGEFEARAISDTETNQARKALKAPPQTEPLSATKFELGDRIRIRILHRQHGEDKWSGKWSGKSAKIWQITSDGWLRVDVEGHKGLRFNLRPDWVERMIEQPPEFSSTKPEQVLSPGWADEPDPETPVIANTTFVPQMEALPRFQAGDRLYVSQLNKQDKGWIAEITEVVEVADEYVKVVVEIPKQSS